MRILTGRLKNRKIVFAPSPALRPTPDKVRVAVMNTLRGKISGARILDVFSGTGALGIEALSSGAVQALFIDKHRPCCRALERTLTGAGLEGAARVLCRDFAAGLDEAGSDGSKYDLVFADPPYRKGLGKLFLEMFVEKALLAPDGWLVLETGASEEVPDASGPLRRKRSARYGDTAVHYYTINDKR